MILPALALGIAFSPTIMRVLRSSLLDVYQEDYIHQARLRGLSERRILIAPRAEERDPADARA